MRFTEIMDGLTNGKKYERQSSDGYSISIQFNGPALETGNSIDDSTGGVSRNDLNALDWKEVILYDLTFSEAMAALAEGKIVEHDDICYTDGSIKSPCERFEIIGRDNGKKIIRVTNPNVGGGHDDSEYLRIYRFSVLDLDKKIWRVV